MIRKCFFIPLIKYIKGAELGVVKYDLIITEYEYNSTELWLVLGVPTTEDMLSALFFTF